MKSFIFAIALTILLLCSGSVLSAKTENSAKALSMKNQNLHMSLTTKNEEKSIASLNSAEIAFKKHKVLFEAIADHEELLRIELQYAAIRQFIQENQFGDALAACAEIELLLEHLPSNIKVKAVNIL